MSHKAYREIEFVGEKFYDIIEDNKDKADFRLTSIKAYSTFRRFELFVTRQQYF